MLIGLLPGDASNYASKLRIPGQCVLARDARGPEDGMHSSGRHTLLDACAAEFRGMPLVELMGCAPLGGTLLLRMHTS